MLARKDESEANHRLEIQRMHDQEKTLANELARAEEQNAAFMEDNRNMASRLLLYEDEAKTMNETLVIKDAEVFVLKLFKLSLG